MLFASSTKKRRGQLPLAIKALPKPAKQREQRPRFRGRYCIILFDINEFLVDFNSRNKQNAISNILKTDYLRLPPFLNIILTQI